MSLLLLLSLLSISNFIGWSNSQFNNLHFNIPLETNVTITCFK